MNCEKFGSLVVDIARGQLTEASLREAATSHAKTCARCAAHFRREQNLSVALKALVLLDENKKAAPQLEANLLAAFRNQAKAGSLPAAAKPVAGIARNPRLYWWAAAAAVLVIALTLLALRVQNRKPTLQEEQTQNHIVQPQKSDEQKPQDGVARPEDNLDKRKSATVAESKVSKKGVEPRHKNLIQQAAKHQALSAKSAPQQKPAAANGKPAEEIATNFMPLYNIPMSEGGQLVRVELPRSALATFGLPVNMALANKPIKADVVIGNDGIARAIRFVQ